MKNQTALTLILASGISTIIYFVAVPQTPSPVPARPAPTAAQKAESADAKKGAEQPAPGLKFTPADALVLNVDLKTVGEVRVQVAAQNSSPKAPLDNLEHKLDAMGFVDAQGNAVAWDTVIDIKGAATTLKPGESEHLMLLWKKDSSAPAGTYEGFLVVSQKEKEIARQVVKVVVPDRLSAFQPLVSKLNIRAYRACPLICPWWWKPEPMDSGIPLRAPVNANRGGLSNSPLLTATTRDFAGTATIDWDGNKDSLTAPEPVLGLRVNSIPFAGKYEGSLNFGKDSGSALAVTLNASDLVIYPLIWLAVCIWAATVAKRWLGGERQLTDWRISVLRAQEHMKPAEKAFTNTVTGTSQSYSLHDAFTGRCQAIWAKIDELRANLLGSLETSSPAYSFVNTKVPELEGFPKAWVAFGKQLEALKQAMAKVVSGTPPLGLGPRPAVLERTDKLLQGQSLSLEQFTAQQTQVAAQITFLDQWSELWAAVQRIHDGMETFKRQSSAYIAAHKDDVKKVNDQLNEVRAQIWLLSGEDDAANKTVAAAVQVAEEKYSELLEAARFEEPLREKKLHVRLFEASRFDERLMVNLLLPEEGRARPEWSPPNVSSQDLQAQLTSTDGALGMLSYVLAVLTGLNTLYFGKPFGTVSDYVTLTLWAFGTKVAVDALSGGLERWVGSKTA